MLSPPLRSLPAALFLFAIAAPAQAEFKIESPIVEYRELEVENAGSIGRDSRSAHDHEVSLVQEFAYGVSERWATEFEAEWGHDPGPGNGLRYLVNTWANKYQVFEQGSQWLELGLWGEYGRATEVGGADRVKLGPLLQKVIGPTITTLNVFVEREVGPGASHTLDSSYGLQVIYDWSKALSPAIEAFGDMGDVQHLPRFNDQQHRLGPVLVGTYSLGELGAIKYNIAYLRGLTAATPQSTYKWVMEYELAF